MNLNFDDLKRQISREMGHQRRHYIYIIRLVGLLPEFSSRQSFCFPY